MSKNPGDRWAAGSASAWLRCAHQGRLVYGSLRAKSWHLKQHLRRSLRTSGRSIGRIMHMHWLPASWKVLLFHRLEPLSYHSQPFIMEDDQRGRQRAANAATSVQTAYVSHCASQVRIAGSPQRTSGTCKLSYPILIKRSVRVATLERLPSIVLKQVSMHQL